MYIDLSKSRVKYFDELEPAEILHRLFSKGGPITVHDLKWLAENNRVAVGAVEGDLELLLKKQYTVNSLRLVNIIENLQGDQLLVLPPEYRIESSEARRVLVKSLDHLLNLDSVEIRRLCGEESPRGRLSVKKKVELQLSPGKRLSALEKYLMAHREELAENVFAGYRWRGKDGHLHFVSLLRCIEGAELRAFQDFAAYRLILPEMYKELQLGKSAKTKYKENLTPEERELREQKIKRYERYLERKRNEGLEVGGYIKKLKVDYNDLVEPDRKLFALGTGRIVRAPSRSRQEYSSYEFKITGIPLLSLEDSNWAYSLVWDIRGNCYCKDKMYHSDFRRKSPHLGHDEVFYCCHEIAALHTLRKIHEEDNERRIPFLPFVLPTAKMMSYLEKLRRQTVIIVFNPQTGRPSKRSLNHTEIENLLWKRVIAMGYEDCFTAELQRFKEEHYDPHLDLIRFI